MGQYLGGLLSDIISKTLLVILGTGLLVGFLVGSCAC